MERIIKELVDNQRTYFNTGATLDLDFRIKQLNKLKEAILDYEEELEDALYDDLNRSKMEAYLCDIGPSIMEINEIIANLRKWAKPELHYSGLMCFPSLFTRVYKMPYGVTLVISPFNFPVYL
ncbi:MAG: aldehyde dehydrogenase family protein, partial [Romboutsia sp.]|nr:aldehyde dehydrogenase family protein [Romboutsia sp.]